MTTKILNGSKIALKILKKLKNKVKLKTQHGKRSPGLAIILIGNLPESLLYIKNKKIAGKFAGFLIKCFFFEINVTEFIILKKIKDLNKDKNIDGILIQLPIPQHLNYIKIFSSINPTKDIEGFHPYNIGKFYQKSPIFRPCTSKGIITLLNYYKINIYNLHALIIGDSNTVGKPMLLELLMQNCTTSIVHKNTKNLKNLTKYADLIIIAIGKPNFLYGTWIKKNSIIIDVGINYINKNTIIGDVHYNSASLKTSYITPVPGGVGPMTVVSLLQNTFKAYQKFQKN
ncbi:bifunctional methylenetetrahydrofolate dehydrogenase/methenyltetrahydrofolate cyclohydrolase FolD [Buchnera aphidicola]|uniref:bifunctional methylenetetrahydrofolate dehydrogenase/methenyltetrahydrofolate cyclohydrolase FolD n=1 Tax=Buchnera aphidicola TaxID=9 RepID=UPI0031B72051